MSDAGVGPTPGGNDMWNRADVLQAELPSSNLVADTHSFARIYAGILDAIDGPRCCGAGRSSGKGRRC